jgi:hypothetical protein
MRGLLAFQPSQPLPRILNLSITRISVFPEVEEFLVMLIGLPSNIFVGGGPIVKSSQSTYIPLTQCVIN